MSNQPAFPLNTPKWHESVSDTGFQDIDFTMGMTLRDYFAAKAMQRLMGKMHDSIFKTLKKSYKTEDAIEMSKGMIVDTAYQWADAMMKAREA
jgi:hypothetical protein